MRRLLLLGGLYGAMLFILPAGTDSSARVLLTFGFLILAAYSAGELAPTFGLPKIVGYMLGGLLFGPFALGIVESNDVKALGSVGQLAIALIAFLAGAELQWAELKARGRQLLTLTSIELLTTFIAVLLLLLALQSRIPFLQGLPLLEVVIFSCIFASITMIHSPAVTMAMLTETGSTSPYARTTLGVVLLADVVVVLVFSLVLAAARSMVPPEGAIGMGLGLMAWEIIGAVPIGVLLGLGVTLYLRYVRTELFLFAVLVAFFGGEVARIAHVETLLTLLVAGFVTQNLSGDAGTDLRHAMERAAAPIFVVFFALAGAKLDLGEVVRLWPLVVPIVLVRLAALFVGTRIGTKVARLPKEETADSWMGLVSQAGVAIGLVTVAAESYPAVAGEMRTMLLAMVAINETIGPILFRRALARNETTTTPAAMPAGPAPAMET
jgi:Kef-type K+ transport system membrane component KefB